MTDLPEERDLIACSLYLKHFKTAYLNPMVAALAKMNPDSEDPKQREAYSVLAKKVVFLKGHVGNVEYLIEKRAKEEMKLL